MKKVAYQTPGPDAESGPAGKLADGWPVWLKHLLIGVQIAVILGIGALWTFIPEIRDSKNLWVLFLYNLPSQSAIALLPHEPIIMYFAKFYPILIVTLIAIAGTLITEGMNYQIISHFVQHSPVKKLNNHTFCNV